MLLKLLTFCVWISGISVKNDFLWIRRLIGDKHKSTSMRQTYIPCLAETTRIMQSVLVEYQFYRYPRKKRGMKTNRLLFFFIKYFLQCGKFHIFVDNNFLMCRVHCKCTWNVLKVVQWHLEIPYIRHTLIKIWNSYVPSTWPA